MQWKVLVAALTGISLLVFSWQSHQNRLAGTCIKQPGITYGAIHHIKLAGIETAFGVGAENCRKLP
jgi:hypothetical protein